MNRDINEHYVFDASSIREFPFILSNAAAKHRLVATGSYSAPWGIMLASKFTWASPIPHAVVSFLNAPATLPSGAPGTPFSYSQGGTGYMALDVQATKNFQLGDIGSFYLRLDALNVTNHENFVDFTDERGPAGLVTGGRYTRTGNITGVPRTLRMSFGVKF